MYAAHAKQAKEEESKLLLESCLLDLKNVSSDNDRFSNFLEIARHIRDGSFTVEDRGTVLETVGVDFLIQLLNTTPGTAAPSHLNTSIALSFFASFSIDPCIKRNPKVKEFLTVVNEVLQTNHSDSDGTQYKMLYKDCEEISANLAQDPISLQYLIDCGTLDSLVDYVTSQHCKNPIPVLKCLSLVCRNKGDSLFSHRVDQFHNMMSLIVQRLREEENPITKVEYSTILTAFLNGISEIEISVKTDWVLQVLQLIDKFMVIKLSPSDSDVVLFLVCALVNAVGMDVFTPELVGGTDLVKAIVARVSVEVYILLDCITDNNASERYSMLDKVYKLLIELIHWLVDEDNPMEDNDCIIVCYRKLVEVTETIMMFLSQVWNQLTDLPKNHVVVLISVRTLGAMLSEITEEPTQQLLDLIPFFDFLCQNVEYSEEVIMDVRSVTQAALENMQRVGSINSSFSLGLTREEITAAILVADTTQCECKEIEVMAQCQHNTIDKSQSLSYDSTSAVEKCQVNDGTFPSEKSSIEETSKPEQQTEVLHMSVHACSPHPTSPIKQQQQINLGLSPRDLSELTDFQQSVELIRAKPLPSYHRQVSFDRKEAEKPPPANVSLGGVPVSWQPVPDDVLSYLIPLYGYLLECQKALSVMEGCGCFSSVVSFIERSLSLLLESKTSSHPESTTVNALSLVQDLYTVSPNTAAKLQCFQTFFEISFLSIPNLLSLSSPPPLVSLKLIEVTLASFTRQVNQISRMTSVRLQHSQARFFSSVLLYLRSFYLLHSGIKSAPKIDVSAQFKNIWPQAANIWRGCIAGLTELVRTIVELQNLFINLRYLFEFFDCLDYFDDLNQFPEDVRQIVDSMITLTMSAAKSNYTICTLVSYSGRSVARKMKITELQNIIDNNKKPPTL